MREATRGAFRYLRVPTELYFLVKDLRRLKPAGYTMEEIIARAVAREARDLIRQAKARGDLSERIRALEFSTEDLEEIFQVLDEMRRGNIPVPSKRARIEARKRRKARQDAGR